MFKNGFANMIMNWFGIYTVTPLFAWVLRDQCGSVASVEKLSFLIILTS